MFSGKLARICRPLRCMIKENIAKGDAAGIHYRDLNCILTGLPEYDVSCIELHNVHGQRYLSMSLKNNSEIIIFGTPKNDLGAFIDGPRLYVYGNAQDRCGNAMNNSVIIVHGSIGDMPGIPCVVEGYS